ncbi:hypothetical protein Pyn_01186 [Prunus yedoensis var. nudiflora]|uniref:Uncharacterized protein n=1 Tax=Prunus yedoensis var. nudiflora TaxID=2094558 RepID=A0A315B2F7_PRUYE|nr:hypothetical protein Pyn_01186 [Prunus yedoensis var. nudiflora]
MAKVVLLDLLRPLVSLYPHICPQRLNRCRPRSICRLPPQPRRNVTTLNLGLMVSYIINTLNSKYVAFLAHFLRDLLLLQLLSPRHFHLNYSLAALAAFHCARPICSSSGSRSSSSEFKSRTLRSFSHSNPYSPASSLCSQIF